MHACSCSCTHLHTCTHITCAHTHAHACTHINLVCTHMCTHLYTYIHAHTLMHTQPGRAAGSQQTCPGGGWLYVPGRVTRTWVLAGIQGSGNPPAQGQGLSRHRGPPNHGQARGQGGASRMWRCRRGHAMCELQHPPLALHARVPRTLSSVVGSGGVS